MSTLKFFLRTIARSTLFGLIAGVSGGTTFGVIFANVLLIGGVAAQDLSAFNIRDIPGAIFAVLFFALIGSVLGSMFGMPAGLVVGVLDGLLVAIMTRLFFYPPKNPRTHRIVISLISALFTGVTAWFCFFSIALFYANRAKADVAGIAGIMLVPALIAAAYGWFIAPRVVKVDPQIAPMTQREEQAS